VSAGRRRFPPEEYLGHMLAAIRRILEYTRDMDQAGFLDDTRTQDAVIRNFITLGEAANTILKEYPEFAREHQDIPLNHAYRMRNLLTHGYEGVDLDVVWRTAIAALPELAGQIEAVLRTGGTDSAG